MQIARTDVTLYVRTIIQFVAICFLLINPIEFDERFSTASGRALAISAIALLLWILYHQRHQFDFLNQIQIIGILFLWSVFISILFSDGSQYYWAILTTICVLFALSSAGTSDIKVTCIYLLLIFALTTASVFFVLYQTMSLEFFFESEDSFYGYYGRLVATSSDLSNILPRSSGFSRSSVISAAFFMMIYLFITQLSLCSRDYLIRFFFGVVKVGLLSIIAILVLLIITAGSRGTLLAILFAVSMTLLSFWKKRSADQKSAYIWLTYTIALVLVVSMSPFLNLIKEVISFFGLAFDRGFSGRERFWMDIVNILPIFPFGFGFNGDRYFFELNNGLSASGAYATTASNGLFFLLISFGYLGIPIFIGVLFVIIKQIKTLIGLLDGTGEKFSKINYAIFIFLFCFILARTIFETGFFVAGIDLLMLGVLFRVTEGLRERSL